MDEFESKIANLIVKELTDSGFSKELALCIAEYASINIHPDQCSRAASRIMKLNSALINIIHNVVILKRSDNVS